MKTAVSADGTTIAYDELGEGPPLLMAAGAFNTRSTTAPLAEVLAEHFTVLNYDRRGRGDSGDADTYAIEREVEDIDALIDAAGGRASLFGYSSGANLALHAAAQGSKLDRLALYEPPIVIDESRPRPPADLVQQLDELVSTGKRGEAVELYQTKAVGLPEELVVQMRNAPFRPGLEGIAHTLVYDAELIRDLSLPEDLLPDVRQPTLVIDGGESWDFLRTGVAALASALPDGHRRTLEGQTHDIDPQATAPAIVEFLTS